MNPLLILLLVLLLIILPIGIYVLCLIFAGKRTDISEENSKTDEFWGCENYPKCRFIKK